MRYNLSLASLLEHSRLGELRDWCTPSSTDYRNLDVSSCITYTILGRPRLATLLYHCLTAMLRSPNRWSHRIDSC